MKSVALLLAITALLFVYGCTQGSVQEKSETVKQGVDIVKAEGEGVVVAEAGDTVSVDYIGAFENGTLFDTSIEAEAKKAGLPLRPYYSPLEFTVGAGQMIAGFDSAVIGMKEGQEKTVTIPPEKAYGAWSQENVGEIPLANIQGSENLRVGSELTASNGARGRVVKIEGGKATVDFNHELAGKTLVFTIRMVKITKGS